MKKHILKALAIFCAIAIPGTAMAQNFNAEFEEFRKKRDREFNKFVADRNAEFNKFREERNKEFAEFLKNSWVKAKPKEKKQPPPQPKPFVPKPTPEDKQDKPTVPQNLPIKEVVTPKPPTPQPKPIVIDKPREEKVQPTITISGFYGNNIVLRTSNKVKVSLADNSQKSVASAWEKMATKELDPLVYDCQQARNKYNFCDWMYLQFLQRVAQQVTGKPAGSNEEALLTGYILAQSGIDFRFARYGTSLVLAVPFDTQVYRYQFFNINNKNYYVMRKEIKGDCYLMDKSFSKEATPMVLRMGSPMKLGNTNSQKKVLASKKYPQMRLEYTTNKALMDFYGSYPRMEWQDYTLTPTDKATTDKIMATFRPLLAGKSETEAVNMILNFVQTAFTYGYDDEIWGGDRPFFADETLYYPNSDCEDRSILFSQLVRMLTKNDVVLLYYPNHLATAVRFNSDIQGDYVTVDGRKYLVCDPTGYKPIGNAYDQFKNTQAKIIKIK